MKIIYDEEDNIIAKKIDGVTAYEWTYDENGNILTYKDVVGDITFTYDYSDENEITSITATNGFVINYEPSEDIYEISYTLSGDTKTKSFESITKENREEETEVIGSTLKLLSNGKFATIITDENEYRNTISVDKKEIFEVIYTTDGNQVSDIKYSDGSSNSYYYDDKGNVIEIHENNKLTVRYTYDSLNQLVREDSAKNGTTTVYSYDKGGNILKTEKYAYTGKELGEVLETNIYTYSDSEWKDLLTEYNGQTITYDEIGNPLSYRDNFNFTWQNGRQLSSIQNDDYMVKYTYDSNDLRNAKTIDGIITEYMLEGDTVVAETTNGKTIWYDYDVSGMPVGFTTEDNSYYYKKNAQGDIVTILDNYGNEVAGYTYDAWGNVTHISGDEEIANLNPFRYKGYYQDNETGFYYLHTRYYDPVTGRFLNADKTEMISLLAFNPIGANLFTYCYNNPVFNTDPLGEGVLPVGGPGYFKKAYTSTVSNWAKKYAPMSNKVEYGAIIYKLRVLKATWYFMGETYKGFQTTNWYTVINGLGAGLLTSKGYKFAGKSFWPITNVYIVGFAHTHTIGSINSNKPSGPDLTLKRLGWIVDLRIFPIAISSKNGISIRYF